MKKTIPIWEKIMLTVEEASEYSNIGINRLQAMLNKPGCTFVFFVGKGKRLVKRKEFEKYFLTAKKHKSMMKMLFLCFKNYSCYMM